VKKHEKVEKVNNTFSDEYGKKSYGSKKKGRTWQWI